MSKTVLITGGAKGIGAAVARLAAKRGYNVAVNYLNSSEQAEELCRELSQITNAKCYRADVSDADAVKAMIKKITGDMGFISCLVNNSAVAVQKMLCDTSEEEWDKILAVNLKGMFLTCKAVTEEMVSRKTGSIVNVSSMWGESGASCEAAYSASKAAVIGLTKSLAKELGPSGIRVNCVSPGCIDTDMNACHSRQTLQEIADETPLGRLGSPEDVAEGIMFLLGEGAAFITGQVLGINGGFIM